MTDITDKDGNPPPKLLSSPEAHWRGLEVGKYPTLPVRGSDFQAGLLLLCTKPEDPTFLAVYPIDHKVIGFSLFGFPSRQIEIRMTVVTECKSEDSKRGNEKRARFALVPDGASGLLDQSHSAKILAHQRIVQILDAPKRADNARLHGRSEPIAAPFILTHPPTEIEVGDMQGNSSREVFEFL